MEGKLLAKERKDYLFIYLLFIIYLLERGEGREKERERNIYGCLSHIPNRGPNLQPRHVP